MSELLSVASDPPDGDTEAGEHRLRGRLERLGADRGDHGLLVEVPEELHEPPGWIRYLEGFRALRAHRPDRFMLGAIVGVPEDLAPTDPAETDWEAILDDLRMTIERHPFWEGLLRPSCEVVGRGSGGRWASL